MFACESSSDFDEDNDGFYDSTEEYTGTDSLQACAENASVSAWPPDFDNDGSVTGADVSRVQGVLGQRVPEAPARNDLNPDGVITGADLSAVAARVGTTCQPPQ